MSLGAEETERKTKTYVIGDIHGCLTALDTLLGRIPFSESDQLILLGDYIDRGPDSKGVLDRIIALSESMHVIPLRGNHEDMMLEGRDNPAVLDPWMRCGGAQTLLSYGSHSKEGWADNVPEAHWTFLSNTRLVHETSRHIFVHGFLDSARDVADQDPLIMLWEKCRTMKPHKSGRQVICGHTSQRDGVPALFDFGVCIDTRIYDRGYLTCLDPDSGHYWQANQEGETREGDLELGEG